jgi:hypothetical protein
MSVAGRVGSPLKTIELDPDQPFWFGTPESSQDPNGGSDRLFSALEADWFGEYFGSAI